MIDLSASIKEILSFSTEYFKIETTLPLILLEVKSISACAMLKHEAAIDKMSYFGVNHFK
jgi:hypothetical protein